MRNKKLSMPELESSVSTAYRQVESFKENQNYLNSKLRLLFDELNSKTKSGKRRYSVFLSAYCKGFSAALHSNLWQNKLEFCYVYDGELYGTHKNTTHKKADALYLNRENSSQFMDSLERGHYWVGTNKKFF